MRLLVVAQRVDAAHDILGFFPTWLAGLAARTAALEVVTQTLGSLPEGFRPVVHGLGKERGAGRLAQAVRLERILIDRLARRRDFDLVFCHMCPEYVPASWPVAALAGVPIALWYTHGSDSRSLRLAHQLAARTLTASLADFPFPGAKVRAIGHGIDRAKFAPRTRPSSDLWTLVSVGRLAPVKDQALLVRAVGRLVREPGGGGVRLRLVGGGAVAADESYAREVRHLIRQEGLEGIVELVGSVPYREIEAELAAADLFVSASRTGSLDKAVLEAMAAGLPVVTSSAAFRDELDGFAELRFREGDAADLAARLVALRARGPEAGRAIGAELARRVGERHDLEAFLDRLVGALAETAFARRDRPRTAGES